MPLAVAPGLLLLLLLASGARGALKVSVPTSQMRVVMGSDVFLGCRFSVGGPVDLGRLVVQWKLGDRVVAEFDDVPSYPRAGASMSLEGLRVGDASLLLPRVGGTDAGLYTCIVIVPPTRESQPVELRVEAPPRVSVRDTVVSPGELSTVTCSVSSFYPGDVTVWWLRGDEVVRGPETPPAQPDPHGRYNATSVLQFPPNLPDADATYSCRVNHVALGEPIQETFRLSVLDPLVPPAWPWVLGIITGIIAGILIAPLVWLVYWCCSRSMSPIRVWKCFPEGRVTALCCEVQGRLSDGDTLTWARQGQGKKRGPGELSALMPKPEQYHVETWRLPRRLGRQRLTSILTFPTPSVDETFTCTFRTQEKHVTVPGVPAVSPDSVLSSL